MKKTVILILAGILVGIWSFAEAQSAAEFFDQGQAYLRQRNLTEAAAAFKKAIEIDPVMGRAYVELGFAYRLQNEYGKAEEAYLKAIELDPNDAGAHLRLGEVYQMQKRDDLAEKEFEKYRMITESSKK